MPNLAKKFAPNSEAFGTSQKNNTAMSIHGSDYVDTRSFNVDITQPPYDNTSDPSNVYTAYPTYYGYNVGRVTGFDEEYIAMWTPGSLAKNAFMRKGLPFDSFVTNAPLIQHDYASFVDTYPNAVDSAAAGGQAIKHNGGYWEQRNMSGEFNRPYSHWHREQAYHVVAHSYTTQPDPALRTSNDWALGVKIYGSAYLAEVYNSNNEPIYDRDILGYNFLEPYDDDGNNPTQTPNIKRLQTKYGRSFSPEDYPDFGLVELVSAEYSGNAFEVALGSFGISGAVTDVRWVNFQEYTDSPGSTEYPSSPVWLPRNIEFICGDIVARSEVIWTPFYVQDPNDSNNLLKFYKIDRLEIDGLRTTTYITNKNFSDAISFEWSECGTNVYILAVEDSALSTNGDAIIARCEIQTGNNFDWFDLAQVEHIYLPDDISGTGFEMASKLNLSRNFQAFKRLNPSLDPAVVSDQLAFTAGVGQHYGYDRQLDTTGAGKGQILSWQASDVNNGYNLSGCAYQRDGSGNSQLIKGIATSRLGWIGSDQYQMSWVPSWRNLVHAQRPNEHREIQQMLFGVIVGKSYLSDPEGQTSNRYFIQAIKVPGTLESEGTTVDDLREDQGKKINVMKTNNPAISEETKYQFFPWVTDTSGDNVRQWDFGAYCSIWSPDGERFIWFGLTVYDDLFPDSPGKYDPYVNGDPFDVYYSYGDMQISPYGLVLYQVECTKPYDISTAQLNTVHSIKMYEDSLSPSNPFRGFTARESGYDGGSLTRLAYNLAFITPDRYGSSGVSGQNTFMSNRKSPTLFGWGVPRKLKWVKSKSYDPYSSTQLGDSFRGYQEFEHGYSLGIIWSGSYGGSNTTSGSYFDNDYNRLADNNDNRSSYMQNVYTELGLTPNALEGDLYQDVPFDLRGKRAQFVWNGSMPKQIDLRKILTNSGGYPTIHRFDDTEGTSTLRSDALAGTSSSTSLTSNNTALTRGVYFADFDFYDNGNRCLLCYVRVAPAYDEMYQDNGTGSSISSNRDSISTVTPDEGDGMAIEIWVDLKLTEPYLLTESTATEFTTSNFWSEYDHKLIYDENDSWFNTIDYQKGMRWSYLSQTMNPREIKLVNGGRAMLRASYPGVIQSVTRPRDYWVPSYENDPSLATDTSLSAQIVRGGGLFGPYAYEKSKRNTQIEARRSSVLTPAEYSAIALYGYNQANQYFAKHVFAYGDSALYYVDGIDIRRLVLKNAYPLGATEAVFDRVNGATENYGTACAFNDDYVVIGCYDFGGNLGYTADGRVNVYDRSLLSSSPGDQSQALLYELNSPYQQDYGQFGYSVALKGNYLVVGAPNEDSISVSSKTGMGNVYLYDLTNGSLVRFHENPETGWGNTSWGNYVAGNGERWGQSVGINSTHIAIGAPNQSNQLSITLYSNIGCIYMFKLSDGSQETNVSIKSFEWTDNDARFGHHLVMTDTKLVSGTLITDYGAQGSADSGEIAMYDITQQNIDNNGLNASVSPFNYEFKISDPNASSTNDNFFGRGPGSTGTGPSQPFAMTDDFIIVSAYRDATTARGDGVAYLYSTSGSLSATLLPDGDTTRYSTVNGFGNSVAITDSLFISAFAGQKVQLTPPSYGNFYVYSTDALLGLYDYFSYYPYMPTMPDTLNAFGELFADDTPNVTATGPNSINIDPTGQAPVLHGSQSIVRGETAEYRSILQLKPKKSIIWSD